MRNLELSLLFRFRDQGSAVAKRAAKDIEATAKETAKVSTAAAKQEADAHISLWRRVTESRKTLGIRSEQEIQSEIRRTQSAYQALAQSGTLSAREQARALKAMKDQVRELNRELKGGSGLMQRMGGVGRGAISMGAGVMAGGYVLNRALKPVQDYDLRLRYMANTAYSEKTTVAEREAGMSEMDGVIRRSVRHGGDRNAAANALDDMIASGMLGEGAAGRSSAMNLLPTIMKYATAANADPVELSRIVLKSKKSLGIQDADFSKVLGTAFLGGKLGGFELKDMSRWLPQQMAAASSAGLTGTRGLAKLVALNQSAMITAGNKDEAGNNVVNFLAKLNAEETSGDFRKYGIKWRQKLVTGAQNGRDAVDVFGDTIGEMLGKNKAYKTLQARLVTAQGDDKKAVLESMTSIVQGAVVGGISKDRQELMAVLAVLNDRKGLAETEAKLNQVDPDKVIETDLAVIQKSAAWKDQQFNNAVEEKQFDALSGFSGAVGDAKLKLAKYADTYPALSNAIVAATTGLSVLGAAAGASGLASLATGGGAGLVARVAGAAAPLAGSAAAVGSAALPWVAGAAAAGGAGYLVGTGINHGINSAIKMGTGDQDQTLGGWIYDFLHREENARLNQPIQLQVQLDGRVIAEAVNDHNGTQAGRS